MDKFTAFFYSDSWKVIYTIYALDRDHALKMCGIIKRTELDDKKNNYRLAALDFESRADEDHDGIARWICEGVDELM